MKIDKCNLRARRASFSFFSFFSTSLSAPPLPHQRSLKMVRFPLAARRVNLFCALG